MNIQSLLQKIEKLEEKLATVIHELRYKTEIIEKLEINISELKK